MRLVPVLALMTSAFALAACAGGGGGLSGSGTLSAAGMVASNGSGVCTIQQTGCLVTPPGGTTTTIVDTDGDGIADGKDGTDGDGDTGSGAGGNTTGHVKGNRTIALEKFVLDKPTDPKIPSISQITSELTPTYELTEAAVMSTSKPKTLKFTIDTKSANNATWAIPAEMPENPVGTRDLRWIEYGHTTVAPASFNIVDTAGNPVVYDPVKKAFVYTVAHVTADGSHSPNDIVEHYEDDFYWNQMIPYMGTKANGGIGDKYREYWLKNADTTVNRDEALQVWNWKNSYTVNYHNDIGGSAAKQQAWSFGGKAATNMQATGKARYGGRFVASAKTSGFEAKVGSKVDPNALWMVQGRSDVIADFDQSTIRGTLSPETWTSEQEKTWYTWYTKEAEFNTAGNIVGTASIGTPAQPDYYDIYGTKITVDGKIVAGDTTTTSGGVVTPVKNLIEGTAKLSGKYQSGDNPLYGGFFGTNGDEMTGIFNVNGTTKELVGGSTGNTNQKESTLTINGSFNGLCAASPGFTCPP
jgi:C-lobe and N-lobe beta barrels of Tf-binding protein B